MRYNITELSLYRMTFIDSIITNISLFFFLSFFLSYYICFIFLYDVWRLLYFPFISSQLKRNGTIFILFISFFAFYFLFIFAFFFSETCNVFFFFLFFPQNQHGMVHYLSEVTTGCNIRTHELMLYSIHIIDYVINIYYIRIHILSLYHSTYDHLQESLNNY